MSEIHQGSIEERVKKELSTYGPFAPAEMKNEMHLFHDLGYDSFDALDTLMGVEDEFGLEIPDEDAVKFDTVQSVIDYVEKATAAQ